MRLRWYHRAALPLIPVMLLPFLAAPTCSGPVVGPRAFGDDSIVIPMDECWQPYNQSDKEPGSVPLGGAGSVCSSSYTKGVLYAYGLVYYLIQNNVPVYWIIDPNKTSVSGVDFTVPGAASQGNLYDWGQATAHAAAHNGAALGVEAAGGSDSECPQQGICYRGGPFVIDGSEFQTVYNLLSSGGVFAQFANNIQLHVMHPTAAYTANVAKTLVGTPPKIAILGIPGVDCYDTAPILTQYLSDAALSGAAVYDVLYASDFNYKTGAFAGSNLASYPLLWVPHWDVSDPDDVFTGPAGTTCESGAIWCSTSTGYACADGNPNSCNNNGWCGTSMTQAQAKNVMSVIGQYVAAGNNLFSECMGIGSMEGDSSLDASTYDQTNLEASTQFQTTGGDLNVSDYAACSSGFQTGTANPVPIPGCKLSYNDVSSSFLQIGDFPFTPAYGLVGKYDSYGSPFRGAESTLVADSTGYDVFTDIGDGAGKAGAGTVVYLGGHSYSTTDGFAQNVAGERMVLNTLFTLAAVCTVPANPACNTGLPGPCGNGQYQCQNNTLVCAQTVFPQPETCNGIDDDCNGLIDDVPPQSCYTGPAGTENCEGLAGPNYPCGCSGGSEFCVNGAWTACEGEQLPSPEVCDGIDNDCNGLVDDGPGGGPLTQACYDGPAGTEGVGLCVGGTEVCQNGAWSACNGEVLPAAGFCDGQDHECDGQPSVCDACTPGESQPCYTGPAGTLGVGLCQAGTEDCSDAGAWGSCTGEVLPALPDAGYCDGLDHDCNGLPDTCPVCTPGQTQACYTGPAGTEGVGICKGGTESCLANGTWGPCVGQVLPGAQYCDGKDDTCTGQVDQGAICPANEVCVNGNCVPSSCGGAEFGGVCPAGYSCTNGQCVTSACGDAGICPAGETCQAGKCMNPCAGVSCGAGSFCSDGTCVAGGCYATGCSAGDYCSLGSCVPNPCNGVSCPDGTFCRGGYCIQACAFVTCPAGQVCDSNGDCEAPPCGGSCPRGQSCQAGVCAPDPCAGVGCAAGQVCSGGVCVDDPCNGVQCPGIMACVGGQCVDQVRDGGTPAGSSSSSSSGGSGSSGKKDAGAASGSSSSGGTSSTSASSSSDGGGSTDGGRAVGVVGGCHCGSAGGAGALPVVMLGLGLLVGKRRRGAASRSPRAKARGEIPRSLALDFARAKGSLARFTTLAFVLAAFSLSCSANPPPNGDGGTSGSSNNSSNSSGGTSSLSSGSSSSGSGTGGATSTSSGSGSGSGGCTVCAGSCVDLETDSANCGACGKVCPSGDSCVLGACGGSTPVGPLLQSISPTAVPAGESSVTLTLTGQRFVGGAQVLLTGDGLPGTPQAATLGAGGTLVTTADFATASPGTVTVAVVDPQQLLSNGLPLTLVTAGSPVLSSVAPTSAPTGAPVSLAFVGQNFVAATEIHVAGGAVPDTALTATIQGATAATATWNLAQVAPGTYQLTAITPGSPPLTSNSLSFQVTSATPTITAVNPDQAPSNGSPALDVSGTGFDASSVVQFGAAGQPPTALTTTLVSPVELFAPLSLAGIGPGAYQVSVQNAGNLVSQPFGFTVDSQQPSIDQVTPDTVTAGATPSLNVLGSSFDPSSVVHLQDLGGGNDVALVTSYVGAGSLTAAMVAATAGSYQLVVVNSGPLDSSPFAFTVAPNTPILSGVAPASLVQSQAPAVVTLTGINFQANATAQLTGLSTGAQANWPLTVAAGGNSATTTNPVNPALLDVDAYLLTVVNPGGAASNAASFSISPGTPVVTAINPNTEVTDTCATGTCAANCVPPTIQITGQFFTPSSVVYVTGINGSGVVSSTYVNPTQLNATPNLCGASPARYEVEVWNSSTLQSANSPFTVTGP